MQNHIFSGEPIFKKGKKNYFYRKLVYRKNFFTGSCHTAKTLIQEDGTPLKIFSVKDCGMIQ
jgi:hypothetical protein